MTHKDNEKLDLFNILFQTVEMFLFDIFFSKEVVSFDEQMTILDLFLRNRSLYFLTVSFHLA